MKKFLLFILTCSISLFSFSQISPLAVKPSTGTTGTKSSKTFDKYDLINEKYEDSSFSMTYENSTPKNIKFSNAKMWIAKTFGDYKSVLQYEDPENNKIIIKGSSKMEDVTNVIDRVVVKEKPNLLFLLTIDCRDDKYRLKFENMEVDIEAEVGNISASKTIHYKYNILDCIQKETRYESRISVCLTSILNSASQAIEKNDDF